MTNLQFATQPTGGDKYQISKNRQSYLHLLQCSACHPCVTEQDSETFLLVRNSLFALIGNYLPPSPPPARALLIAIPPPPRRSTHKVCIPVFNPVPPPASWQGILPKHQLPLLVAKSAARFIKSRRWWSDTIFDGFTKLDNLIFHLLHLVFCFGQICSCSEQHIQLVHHQ